ncbi:MAG TPA: response regulator [Terracidiphilus sp.]|nr:response regulator [Terracidiphilus sp.]
MTQSPLILLVDDEPVLTETLVQIFEGEGFRSVTAADGISAIRMAEEARPDVVICDVMMPGTNGVEAAKEIQRLIPGIPIYLFSGQAAAAGLIEAAKSEGNHFQVLAKPIRPEFLVSVIRQQLQASSAMPDLQPKE